MNAIARRLSLSFKPALIHLCLSATVALLAILLIFLGWYPGALASLQGVSRLVLILIAVDVVIGPLVTFIVYVPGKKSLKFDLLVIAALQTAALLYGLQAIHGGRPAYVVFSVDRFDVVALQDVDRDSLARSASGVNLSPLAPKWFGARFPEDPGKRSDILWSSVQGGPDLQHLPEYFVPLGEVRDEMRARLRPLAELRTLNALDDTAWQALLDELGGDESGLGYLPAVGNARDGAVIVEAQTGAVLGLRLLTPSFQPLEKKPVAPEAEKPRVPPSGPPLG